MARRVIESFTDDLDDSVDDVQTVQFALSGTAYEIDLSAQNRKALAEVLAEFIDAGRKVSTAPAKSRGNGRRKADTAEVRAWARERGIAVNDRGRVPADIATAFATAQKAEAPKPAFSN